jgi:hypothetical protein
VLAGAVLIWFAIMMLMGNAYSRDYDPHGGAVASGSIILATFCVTFLGSRWVSLPAAAAFVVTATAMPVVVYLAFWFSDGPMPNLADLGVFLGGHFFAPAIIGLALSRVP